MTITEKVCSRCGEVKPISAFNRMAQNRSGYRPECRECKKTGRVRPPRPFAERFWARVAKADGCWPWLGQRTAEGYGVVLRGGRRTPAHRVAYELTYGPVPAGHFVCHHCDTPPCCRPVHLFAGTNGDNMRDARDKGRLARGERNAQARITLEIVLAIRARHRTGHANRSALAREFHLSITTITRIIERRAWTWVDESPSPARPDPPLWVRWEYTAGRRRNPWSAAHLATLPAARVADGAFVAACGYTAPEGMGATFEVVAVGLMNVDPCRNCLTHWSG